WHPAEVAHRPHNTRAAAGLDARVEPAAPPDVDVLGAALERLLEDAPPIALAAVEPAAFPPRPAGDDHRPLASGQGACHVNSSNAVEAQLNQVRLLRCVTSGAQLGHRAAGDGLDEQRALNHESCANQQKSLSSGLLKRL